MRRLRNDDSGAVATIVAILLSTTVLLAVAALTVDMGQLYAERREIQNGADAAALALAQSCARAESACNTAGSASAMAADYADVNAKDGTTAVTEVCVRKGASTLGSCSGSSGHWTDCLPSAPPGDYVQIRTRTRMADGTTLYPRSFSRALTGFAGDPGTPVVACARANWGGVAAAASSVALTFSLKEWECMTGGGTTYAPPPPYPATGIVSSLAPYEKVLKFHTVTTSACPAAEAISGPSGWNLPGGFGWLDDTSGTCSAYVSSGGTVGDHTGAPASGVCKAALEAAWTSRKVLYLPVFDGVTGTGNGLYHIKGYAAFVLTGYRFPGSGGTSTRSSWVTGSPPCGPPNTCISGFFTEALVDASAVPTAGGPSMGASVVGMVG